MAKAFEIVMDSRKQIVEQLIQRMEQDGLQWKKGWNQSTNAPNNPVSGVIYRGGNRFRLIMASAIKGYEDNRWLTFKQAQEKGYKIKPKEKGTLCEKWIFTKEVELENKETGEKEKVKVQLEHPVVNYFIVFNGQQIDGIPPAPREEKRYSMELDNIERRILEMSECPIYLKHQDEAFYNPKMDCIVLPTREQFHSQQEFIATALHEQAHSTGHPSRLNRNLKGKFGTESYAKEELRAELSSLFAQGDIGINLEANHIDNHAAYINSWIRAIKDDPNELFRACAEADQISNRLMENYNKVLEREQLQDKEQKQSQKKRKALSR